LSESKKPGSRSAPVSLSSSAMIGKFNRGE
jgi:hypothetical protein